MVDFGTRASCIPDVFEAGLDVKDDFDLRLLEECWLFDLLASEDSFFLEEASLRDLCLVWRLPTLTRLPWLSLRSSFDEFNEEVVITDLCAEATERDDDKVVLIAFAGAYDKIYPGGSDFVSMKEL